jgi:L-rhamnonate dehydratase
MIDVYQASGTTELADHFVGMDVRDTEATWQSLTRWANWIGPGGLLQWSLAPLDIAIWDVLGKTLGLPIFWMLGGYRHEVVACASARM